MTLFEKLMQKIAKEKTIEVDDDKIKQRYQEKLEVFKKIHEELKSKPKKLEKHVSDYVNNEDELFEGFEVSDVAKYIKLLQELDHVGLIEFSDGDFKTISTEILEELSEKKKESQLGKIEKKHLEQILKMYESEVEKMRKFDFNFIDRPSFLKYLDGIMSRTEQMRQNISKVDGDFVSGSVFEKFIADKKGVEARLKAVCEVFNVAKELMEFDEADFERAKNLIEKKLFKITDGIKDRENYDIVTSAISEFQSVEKTIKNVEYILKYSLKKSQINTDETADKVINLTKSIEIKEDVPTIDFDSDKLFIAVAGALAKNEKFNKILETDKVEKEEDLFEIANVVFNAIENYMRKINCNFIFDADYVIDEDAENSEKLGEISTYTFNDNSSAEITIFKNSILDSVKKYNSGVKEVFKVLEVILHETAHRIDYVRDVEEYKKTRNSSYFSELMQKGYLGSEMGFDKQFVELAKHLCPSLDKELKKTKAQALEVSKRYKEETLDEITDYHIEFMLDWIKHAAYLKYRCEIFARHTSAEGLEVIVRALKYYYAKEIKDESQKTDSDNLEELTAKNKTKNENLSRLDSSEIVFVDDNNNGYYVEFEEGNSDEIYLITADKFDPEEEKIIQKCIKLCKNMVNELKQVCDYTDILNILIEVGKIEDKKLRKRAEVKASKIIYAYIFNLPNDEKGKILMQAIENGCEPVALVVGSHKIFRHFSESFLSPEELEKFNEFISRFPKRKLESLAFKITTKWMEEHKKESNSQDINDGDLNG